MYLFSFFLDRSVIQLSAKAFRDPSGYFEDDESPTAVRSYAKQLLNGINERAPVSDSVLNEKIPKVCS